MSWRGMTEPRRSPVGDFDRWAVVQVLSARHTGTTHRQLLATVGEAERQMLAEEYDAFAGLSRAGWRAELADRAQAILRGQT